MINKTLVISSYIIDDKSGSEPGVTYHFIKEISKYFESILVFTSSLTPDSILTEIKHKCKNVNFVETKFPLIFQKNKFGTFYIKYRIFLLRQSNQIRRMQLNPENHVGIHYSLSNLLIGTSLYKSGIPYIFGPASTSKFSIRYIRIARLNVVKELVRYLAIRLILRLDFVVRKSLDNAEVIITGDLATQKLLNLKKYSTKISPDLIPHTCVDQAQTYATSSTPEKRKDVIWCGAFSARKDPLLALEVIRSLRDDFGVNDFKLRMFGTGSKFNQIAKYIEKFQLKNVEVNLWVDKLKLLDEMRRSKLLLFTSYRESGGAQILEALACGMSVVSCDATAAKEWLSNESIGFVTPSIHSSRTTFARAIAAEVLSQFRRENTLMDDNIFTSQGQAQRILNLLDLFD